MRSRTATAALLWALWFLFLLRVIGQLMVLIWSPSFLPPMPAWFSGLLPYPYLLVAQIIILIVFARIAMDLTRGRGFFYGLVHPPARGLIIFALVYGLAMVVRFLIQGLSIPVVFHWVLAGYLFTLGRYYLLRHRA